MANRILLAPIQGVTDYHFRNTFNKFFKGVDFMYSPYLRVDKNMQLKNSKVIDILPSNNKNINLVPQIMTNKPEEFTYMSKFLFDKGYEHINWNLGCPFAMVTNRELGSGLLPHHNKIEDILEKVMTVLPIKLSIKMRIGLENENDIFKILPILDKFPILEIIIHPRTGKQMYKGQVYTSIFEKCLALSSHKICYNGDINALDDYNNLSNRFKTVNSWMIGRGLIKNPFLAMQINKVLTENKMEIFKEFHDALCEEYLQSLSGSSHLLSKMIVFWEYFSLSFSNSHKVYKRIKKATSISKYKIAVAQNCNEEKWIA
ncbi:MAG: tRNA-dihydrouridine synthase family protein [Bacteroidales bacterium]|jgi:tRNA-dihydrouridine synthase B|nr:tRNA-dihydrouridine synthase family protein [Bacteroidales bacterium]